MNSKIGKLTFGSIAATIALIAIYGKDFAEALGAFPALLTAFSSGMPFGVSSFLLAWALSGLFYSFVRRWMTCKRAVIREFGAQMFALCVGLGVCVAQQVTRETGAPDLLQALWVGALAGLSAPMVVQGMMAMLKDPEPPKVSLDKQSDSQWPGMQSFLPQSDDDGT